MRLVTGVLCNSTEWWERTQGTNHVFSHIHLVKNQHSISWH